MWLRPFRKAPYKNPFGRLRPFKDKSVPGLYRMFNHGESQSHRDIDVPYLPKNKELYTVGKLQSLVYLPYGSSRKPHDPHVHRFGDFGTHEDYNPAKWPLLAADAEGNMFILRDNSPYYMDSRGIVG